MHLNRIRTLVVTWMVFSGFALTAPAAPEMFPPEMQWGDPGNEVPLTLTGTAERNVLFIQVYKMAHYLQTDFCRPGAVDTATLFSDEAAKHIRMKFMRDLPYEKIRGELRKSMERNAEADWLEEAAPSVERFLAAIDRDAKKEDQFTLTWLPGGKTVAQYNNQESLVFDDPSFARVLWSIWFGEQPVVSREDLLEEIQRG